MVTKPRTRSRVLFHQSRTGWRFRVIASDGRVLATSSEGFKVFADCEAALEQTKYALIYVVTEGGPKSS